LEERTAFGPAALTRALVEEMTTTYYVHGDASYVRRLKTETVRLHTTRGARLWLLPSGDRLQAGV